MVNLKECCFIIGVDNVQEWMIPWWYDNFVKQNSQYNLSIFNFGMSQKALDYCDSISEIIDLKDNYDSTWFKKPIAIKKIHKRYENIVWVDIDCEIRSDIGKLFNFAQKGFAVTIDTHAWFCRNPQALATGVIAVAKSNKVLKKWIEMIEKHSHNFRGDQEVLNDIVLREGRDGITIIPSIWQGLRCAGDKKGNKIMHWTGPKGKDIIKQQMVRKAILPL